MVQFKSCATGNNAGQKNISFSYLHSKISTIYNVVALCTWLAPILQEFGFLMCCNNPSQHGQEAGLALLAAAWSDEA